MEVAERLEKYFNELDPGLMVRLQKPFPAYYSECEEFKECYIYSAFYDKPNGSTDVVEVVHYFNEDIFSVCVNGIKEVDNIEHVISILDKFFKNQNLFK